MKHSVYGDRPAGNSGVASELALPQAVAENRGLRAFPRFLLGVELSAEEGLNSERAKESRRDVAALSLLRSAVPLQVEQRCKVARGCQAFEHSSAAAVIQEIGRRDSFSRALFPASEEAHQPLRLAVRKRIQEHTVHDAEDRRARSDAERENRQRGERQAGAPAERSNRKPEILRQCFDSGKRFHVTALLFDLLHAAKLAQSGGTGLLGSHPGRQVLLNLAIDMEAQLFVEFAIEAAC